MSKDQKIENLLPLLAQFTTSRTQGATYIFNNSLVVPIRVGVLQQTLEGVSVLFVAKALFALITSDRHQTYNELPGSGAALRKLNAFLHG